ncbi:MAG: helix-turn-helix transcriptional regulator [Clostridia bacterium]|nr:helix-turn-helix transcriptional regulator [Clostridia bacterium]
MAYDHRAMGQLIGRLRTVRGLTQDVLAGLAGLHRPHLTSIENGRKAPSVDTLWRIADALGIPLSELIRLAEEAQQEDG